MSGPGSRVERMRATLRREGACLQQMADALDEQVSAAVDLLLSTTGHVLTGGAGTSNSIAMRFAHLLSCCGRPALFLQTGDALHGGSGSITPHDTLVLISKGGRTREINLLASIAKERGAKLIAFTENPDSELGKMADAVVMVKIAAGSDPFGMVATSSSLANAAVADAICEAILAESGYTQQQFARTHPGGAVGHKIEEEGLLR